MTNIKAPKLTTVEIAQLLSNAHALGMAAVECLAVRPMIVEGYAPIDGGPCGFAWVNVRPANGAIAKALVARFEACKDSYGVTMWVSDFGQSMARKEAYARAFATELRGAGVDARPGSRMD